MSDAVSNPLTAPALRPNLPTYPIHLELLRVTSSTVAGPTGGASAGLGTGNIAPSSLYVSSTQQLRTDTLAPRDREPCLVVPAPNADGVTFPTLTAGYYLGRLAGSYSSLPVYEVVMSSSSTTTTTSSTYPQGTGGLPGLTPDQAAALNASLTPAQIANLGNLTACQLQVLMQLPVVNIQMLTTDLQQTLLSYVVDRLEFTPLKKIATEIPRTQVVVVSSAFPQLYELVNKALTPAQATNLLNSLTSQQFSTLLSLTGSQLQTVVQLTTAELTTLTSLTGQQVSSLVGNLTASELGGLLDTLSLAQLRNLTNSLTPRRIEKLARTTTPTKISTVVPGGPGGGLTPSQLTDLADFPPSTMGCLLDNLSMDSLRTLLNIGAPPPPPTPVLGKQAYFPNLVSIVGQPSSTPSPLISGYVPIVVDGATGKLWANIGGVWANLSLPAVVPVANGGVPASPVTANVGAVVGSLSGSPTWYKVNVTKTTFSINAATINVNLLTVPAGANLLAIKMKHSVPFTGGSISAYTLSVGITGNNTFFFGNFSVFQAAGALVYGLQYPNSGTPQTTQQLSHTGTTTITITATAVGDTLNHATAGDCDLWLLLSSTL